MTPAEGERGEIRVLQIDRAVGVGEGDEVGVRDFSIPEHEQVEWGESSQSEGFGPRCGFDDEPRAASLFEPGPEFAPPPGKVGDGPFRVGAELGRELDDNDERPGSVFDPWPRHPLPIPSRFPTIETEQAL